MSRIFDDILNRPLEQLILTEGRIMGSRYYCVEPVGGNWLAMEAWAHEHYGAPADVWNLGRDAEFIWPEMARWYINSRRFWFRDEADRSLFLLRWQ